MSHKKLHIVSFDVPFPPDYGGAIDVFFRIKALHALGVEITLHCFHYGRGMPEELKEYTHTIQYYKRKKTFADWLSRYPFIVKSRASNHLIRNLLMDDAPILFEGLHTCFFLSDDRLKNRIKLVRAHNIEHEYYSELAKHASGVKKQYFVSEAKKLARFEPTLKHANRILAIKQSDAEHFEQYNDDVKVLPPSLPALEINPQRDTEPYCLFQGNLSVVENENAVKWLIEHVFEPINLTDKLVVAGKNPSSELNTICSENNVALYANPDDHQMEDLTQNARIHVLYSDQATGVKLKLLNALCTSGHVIVNHKMIEGTGLVNLCNLALIKEDFQYLVQNKLIVELSSSEYHERVTFLRDHFDTQSNCRTEILPLL